MSEFPESWKPFVVTPKRIVVQHPDGMMQIVGYSDRQPPDMLHPYGVPINLVTVKDRYYLYKPLMVPQARSDHNPQSFNPQGGTTAFNPGQR